MFKYSFTYFLFVFFLLLSFIKPDSKNIEEYNAKSLFIYNFTKYIEWENIDLIDEFNIAVYKSSQIFDPLKNISFNKKIFNKKINVKELRSLPEYPDFQIIFIPEKTPLESCESIKNNQRYKNILIISENPKHFKDLSTINFIIDNKKIKFEINLSRAESSNLKISSQLLKLAVNIIKQ